MSYLNRKCTLTYKSTDCIKIHWPSAKCIEENNGFVRLIPYDKAHNVYDETKSVWIDLMDKHAIILWR